MKDRHGFTASVREPDVSRRSALRAALMLTTVLAALGVREHATADAGLGGVHDRLVARLATATVLAETRLASDVLYVATLGYHRFGDGGDALYRRAAQRPTHAGHVRSADGTFWTLQPQGETVNVRQFGARGDGKTDDTASLRGATEALRALEASTLLFPSGRYAVSGPFLRLKAGDRRLAFVGADAETTHILPLAPIETPLIEIIGGQGHDRVEWISFRELTFRGNNRRRALNCVHIMNAYHIDWVRCRWLDIDGYALRLDNYWDSNFEGCRIIGCGSVSEPAVWIGSTDQRDWSNNLYFMACQFEASRNTQVFVDERTRKIHFVSCKFHGPIKEITKHTQLLIRGGTTGKIIACTFAFGQEHNFIEFLFGPSGSPPQGWVVSGNDFSYAYGAAIHVRAGHRIVIADNVFGAIAPNRRSIVLEPALAARAAEREIVVYGNVFASREPLPDAPSAEFESR